MRHHFTAVFILLGLSVSGCAHSPVSNAMRFPASRPIPGSCGEVKVPRYLYHYGRKSILDRDIEARTVPEKDWNEFIMGDKTTWGLPKFRRGLYGTEKALRADAFANRKEPGLMRIEIRKECAVPERTVTFEIQKDPRFRKWLGSRYANFSETCVKADGDLLVRNYTQHREVVPTEAMLKCEKLIDDFFNAADIRVVQDEVVAASWYIRDRRCIRTIEGTANEMLGWIAAGEFFSSDRCGRLEDSLSTFRIFMAAFLENSPELKLIDSLRSEWARAGLASPPTPVWADSFISAYLRCNARQELELLRDAVRKFDDELSEIELYDYYIRMQGESPADPFPALCR